MEKELKIKVTTDGSVTIAQLEANIKKLREGFKNAAIGSNEYAEAGKKLKTVLEQKSKAMEVAQTENAKLMKSYFSLGQEIRSKTNPAFISFNQVIQDAPFGIRGIGNNVQFLTQQFTQLRSSGMSTKDILKGMMQNVLTPMGGLMFAVSAGTSLLTVVMDQLGQSTEKTKEKMRLRVGSLNPFYGKKHPSGIVFSATSPTGEEFVFQNTYEAAKIINANNSFVYGFCIGTSKTCKGWTNAKILKRENTPSIQ